MSWWSTITGAGVTSVVDAGVRGYEAVKGNKADGDRALFETDIASIQAYSPTNIAPPMIPPDAGGFYTLMMWSLWMIRIAFDVVIWGARPLIFLSIFYVFFWWPYSDPIGYTVYMQAIAITPPPYMNFALGSLGGFLGIRTIIKDFLTYFSKGGYAAPSITDARRLIALKEEVLKSEVSIDKDTITNSPSSIKNKTLRQYYKQANSSAGE